MSRQNARGLALRSPVIPRRMIWGRLTQAGESIVRPCVETVIVGSLNSAGFMKGAVNNGVVGGIISPLNHSHDEQKAGIA